MMKKTPILSTLLMMMLMVLAALCLSGVSAGKSGMGGSRSGSGSGGGGSGSYSKKRYKKKKSQSSGSSRSMTSSKRLVKIRKSEYYRNMSRYGKGTGDGGGRYRGYNDSGDSDNGGGAHGGKGKGGVFSHDDNDNSNVNQDELSSNNVPTPVPYIEPPIFEQHFPPTTWPNPAPIPTLFLPPSSAEPTLSENIVNGTPTSTGNVDLDEYDQPSSSSGEPEPLCETTNGVFGSLDNESVVVNFGYELETSEISDEYLMDEVLPALEVQFNDLILPAIFPLTCNATLANATTSTRRSRRRLVVTGISARPDDEPISTNDVSCLFLSFTDSECRLVRGMLTLFVADYQPSDSAQVRDALKAAMNDNSFADVNPSIRRVAYVEVQDDSEQSPTDPDAEQDGKDIDGNSSYTDSNSLLVGLVVAGAGGICIAAAAVTYARIARKDAAPDSIIGGSTADIQGGASQLNPYDSVSIGTSASISTSEYQMLPNATESILVDPEQQQDVESVDEMLDPLQMELSSSSVNHDGEDLLASTDHEQPSANTTFAT
jgi:hypothetical protein